MSLNLSSGGSITPNVAVRSSGLALDSVIAFAISDEEYTSIVDEGYLRVLTELANQRFKTNTERIARFASLLLPGPETHPSRQQDGREDPGFRKARKREEGLARQRALQQEAHGKSERVLRRDDELAHGECDAGLIFI
jgi:tRNA wybutosine-synthesizing protein 3